MAMSDPTSDPDDWTQLFHRASSGGYNSPFNTTSIPTESTVVTTATTACAASAGGSSRSRNEYHIVGKTPPRKRSRTSRRAPTTLLNTDTANFRAMVQQFTGVQTGTYTCTDGGQSAVGLGFGSGSENQIRKHTAGMSLGGHQYLYSSPQSQQRQDQVMNMGHSMAGTSSLEDEQVIPDFFLDGMGHGYTFNG